MKHTLVYLSLLLIIVISSCSKMDDYKEKFIPTGQEIDYAGKLDSMKVYSGKNKVEITGLLISDPKVTICRIYWDTRKDSIDVPVNRTSAVDTLRQTISNLTEGSHTFEAVTIDAAGNRSVSVFATGLVYGSRFEQGLLNRPVVSALLDDSSNALITWGDFDITTGAKGSLISYISLSTGDSVSLFAPVSDGTTTLPDYKPHTMFSYSTLYLPDSTDIDTLYTSFQQQAVVQNVDVTSMYLGNYGPNFKNDAFDGRFGTLAAPWISNDAAKNKDGGTIGGFAADEGGVINWETWGNTPVTDGKIYQITSSPLPAGNFTLSFTYYSEVQQNSSVYLIAAAGSNGIPSLPDLSNSLGFTAMFNGANVGTTSPNLSETKSFSFTLASSQPVSIGFLGNIVGNGNPGSYFQVKSIKLIQVQ